MKQNEETNVDGYMKVALKNLIPFFSHKLTIHFCCNKHHKNTLEI